MTGVEIIDSFKLQTDKPLDERYVVNSYYDVSSYWFNGMQVYQQSNNQLYVYDASRGKFLSAEKFEYVFGRTTLTGAVSGYLTMNGATHSSTEGLKMPYNGTILSATVDNTNIITRDLQIRINNSPVATLSLTAQKANSLLQINQDFSAGNLIQIFSPAAVGNTLSNVTFTIEVAWR